MTNPSLILKPHHPLSDKYRVYVSPRVDALLHSLAGPEREDEVLGEMVVKSFLPALQKAIGDVIFEFYGQRLRAQLIAWDNGPDRTALVISLPVDDV